MLILLIGAALIPIGASFVFLIAYILGIVDLPEDLKEVLEK
jgi:hypothetical protein